MGGGAELATSTDFRVMSTKGKIQFVQSRMGVSCGWGGTSRLVKVREGRSPSCEERLARGLMSELKQTRSLLPLLLILFLTHVHRTSPHFPTL
jgi:hypothetical protein